jgi:cell division protein FtsB
MRTTHDGIEPPYYDVWVDVQKQNEALKADNAKLRAGIQKLKQAGSSEMKRRSAIIELIQMIDTKGNDGKQSELEM